ncbi:MAG: DnaJ C-terminal domain-containing protein, partial [Brevundimonas sp.]
VSVPDAVLGGKAPVRTPDGTVNLTIPKGSNTGQVLRLKGRGGYANGQRGDLKVRLLVALPESPDEALVKFSEEWRARRPYQPGRGPPCRPRPPSSPCGRGSRPGRLRSDPAGRCPGCRMGC